VFIEPLLRNGLHNPDVPPLLCADDTENTASSIDACWTVFTDQLPGHALIKSVTVLFCLYLKAIIFKKVGHSYINFHSFGFYKGNVYPKFSVKLLRNMP
jgi:hypothetical protein